MFYDNKINQIVLNLRNIKIKLIIETNKLNKYKMLIIKNLKYYHFKKLF